MDFKLFIDALLTGTPLAILAALVGIIWQAIYVRTRDKLHDEQLQHELEGQKFAYQQEMERRKFEHLKELGLLKFEYKQRRWREALARELTLKIVEERIVEYSKVWVGFEEIS